MAKSKVEIIEETVKYYSVNARAKNDVGCYYFSPGKPECMCAVGRCLSRRNPVVKNIYEDAKTWNPGDSTSHVWTGVVVSLNEKVGGLEKALMPAYRGHNSEFWQDLQRLHDSDQFWDLVEGGLNEAGKEEVKKMTNRYAKC